MELPEEVREKLDNDLDNRMQKFVESYRNVNLDMSVDTSPIMKEALSSARGFFEEENGDNNLQNLFSNEMMEQFKYVENAKAI